MKNQNVRNIIGIAITILLGLGVALAGSQGGFQIGGYPVYALGVLIAFLVQWLRGSEDQRGASRLRGAVHEGRTAAD